MDEFIQLLGGALAEIKKHYNQGIQYSLVLSRVTAFFVKDSTKSKKGERMRRARTPSLSYALAAGAPITRLISAF